MGKMQFAGSVQGNAKPVIRYGTKVSGMTAHLRGWNVGVRVELRHIDGQDVIMVFRTGGSNDAFTHEQIAKITEDSE